MFFKIWRLTFFASVFFKTKRKFRKKIKTKTGRPPSFNSLKSKVWKLSVVEFKPSSRKSAKIKNWHKTIWWSERKDQNNHQSSDTATFAMVITHNKLRIGIRIEYKHYCEIEDGKGNVLSGINLQPCAPLLAASDSSGFVFMGFPAPWYCGRVVECMHRYPRRGSRLSSGTG